MVTQKGMTRPVLGISVGDPAGVGPEVTVKALSRAAIYEKAVPLVFADRLVLEDALKTANLSLSLNAVRESSGALGESGVIDFVDAGLLATGDYAYGEVRAASGEAAFQYVVAAIKAALSGYIDAVVTAPINKEALHLAGHDFAGHTEIFAQYTKTSDYGMLLSGGGLNVIHATTHVSMRDACALITEERITKVLRLADLALCLMGKESRRIAVAGLNPHASENGLFGHEEERAIIPAIIKARAGGLNVTGPVPPDTVFVRALGGDFDIVVAMYHDQGHIPLKLCGFKLDPVTGLYSQMSGVNATIGLPIVRTSVDHGTAFDRAGKNRANAESMIDAIYMAITIAKNMKKQL